MSAKTLGQPISEYIIPIYIHALTVAKVSQLAAEQYHAAVVANGHIYIVPHR